MTLRLTCRELVELVTDYLDGTLSRAERTRFEAHLAACDGCTAYVKQFRTTIQLTGSLAEEDLEPHMRDTLLSLFRDWKGSPGD